MGSLKRTLITLVPVGGSVNVVPPLLPGCTVRKGPDHPAAAVLALPAASLKAPAATLKEAIPSTPAVGSKTAQ
jgi:hypothetical protein